MFDNFKNLCGIYKINFPNGKSYIGLSSNIQKRLITHNKTWDDLPVHKAIIKYGKITEKDVEILEILEHTDRKKLQEREKYWINYYNTYKNGYNLTLGGDGAAEGVANVSAKLNQETLDELITDLIENKIFIKDLSVKYSLSREAISGINQGKRYYNEKYTYPLRPNTQFTSEQMKGITGVNKASSKFSQEQLDEIIDLLKDRTLTFREIAKEYGCTYSTISNINNGKHYFNNKIDYPIRKKPVISSKITEEDVKKIIAILKVSKESFAIIGEQFDVSGTTISRINSGKYHYQSNIDYPIKK